MSDEEFNEAYWKALHVDHIDGDRENMIKDNLVTVCPTFHGIKTYVNASTAGATAFKQTTNATLFLS